MPCIGNRSFVDMLLDDEKPRPSKKPRLVSKYEANVELHPLKALSNQKIRGRLTQP